MISKKELLDKLPPFDNKTVVVNWGQSVQTIMRELVKWHEIYETDYDLISHYFDTGDVYTTCRGLWDFCKYNLKYNIESDEEQSVKSPAAILQPKAKVDCKHYSLFIGGVLDSIKQAHGDSWDWFYRFVSDKKDQIIGHVFVCVNDNGRLIQVDPVMLTFDENYPWTKIKDERPTMPVFAISGVNDLGILMPGQSVTVDKQTAENSFLVLVGQDWMNLKTILRSDPEILYGPVREWYEGQGYDFNHLLVILSQ